MESPITYTDKDGKKRTAERYALIALDSDGNEVDHQETFNGGASSVNSGNANIQSHNRYRAGITDTNIVSTDFKADEEVRAVRFKLIAGTGAVVGDTVRFVANATPVDDIADTVQAANWLALAADSSNTDVEYFEIVLGGQGTTGYVPVWSEWFHYQDVIRRIDMVAAVAGRVYNVMQEIR